MKQTVLRQGGGPIRLDRGEIVGGFEHAYEAWGQSSPGTDVQKRIAGATGLRPDDTVSVTVELPSGQRWSRWFSSGFDRISAPCLFMTPHLHVLGVRVGGIAFVVDVLRPEAAEKLEVTPLVGSASDTERGLMFLADFIKVYAFDGVRIVWSTRRLSLDGISGLRFEGGLVHGFGTAPGEENLSFTVDATTGDAWGGFEL